MSGSVDWINQFTENSQKKHKQDIATLMKGGCQINMFLIQRYHMTSEDAQVIWTAFVALLHCF